MEITLCCNFLSCLLGGVNEWDSDNGSFKKYDMNLQFGTDEGSEGAFLEAMKVLQEKILSDSVKYLHSHSEDKEHYDSYHTIPP